MVELGFPAVIAENSYGFYAPAGTTKPVVERLNREIVKALRQPEVKERFASLATEVVGTTPEAHGDYVVKELAKWSETAKEAGARVD